MISVSVKFGNGDKEAPTVNDDLISTEQAARQRALQELAGYFYITKKRTLRLPHDPDYALDEDVNIIIPKLQIFGQTRIEKLDISMAPGKVYNNITIVELVESEPVL